MRIFVVEDNQAHRELLEQMLAPFAEGHALVCASTQHEAIHWLKTHPSDWDLAVVDLFLAQGHGFAVLKQCAGRAASQKVVFMSNYTDEPVRERAMAEGADLFVEKGTEVAQLLAFAMRHRASLSPQHTDVPPQ